jgi:aspartate/methionine/tyrosine aminotransferase
MIAAMLGLLDPGDEVIVFEPFYEQVGCQGQAGRATLDVAVTSPNNGVSYLTQCPNTHETQEDVEPETEHAP